MAERVEGVGRRKGEDLRFSTVSLESIGKLSKIELFERINNP